jgi:hypothetical protein
VPGRFRRSWPCLMSCAGHWTTDRLHAARLGPLCHRVQLSLEERLVAYARAATAARLPPEQAAAQLGTEAMILDKQLAGTATQARGKLDWYRVADGLGRRAVP